MATQGRITQSLYEVLGVPSNASDEDIKRAYRALAKKYHPDVNQGNPQAEMMFRAIGRAFEVLGDPDRRADYDEALQEEREGSVAAKGSAPGRRVDGVFFVFAIMLILAMIFFFFDTPKGIYFLIVAIALEIRTSIEALRADLQKRR